MEMFEFLFKMESPYVTIASERLYSEYKHITEKYASKDDLSVEFDCHEIKTKRRLFTVINKRLSFPKNFGYNWNALRDWLSDLDWIRPTHVCLVFKNCEWLLSKESHKVLSVFLELLEICGDEFAAPHYTPIDENDNSVPPRPFHSILFSDEIQAKRIKDCSEQTVRLVGFENGL